MRNLKHSLRLLRKSPGFAAIAILTITLGIGANTAIFSVVKSVLLDSLPYREPERVVTLWTQDKAHGFPRDIYSPARFLDTQRETASFEGVAAYHDFSSTLNGVDEPEQIAAVRATANLFEVLGVSPMMGRSFAEGEGRRGAAQVVLLSHGFWVRRFGGDRAIVNRTILLDGAPHTVLGVLPPGFAFPNRRAEVFLPLALEPRDAQRRGALFLYVVARLKAGVSVEQASASVNALSQRLKQMYPESDNVEGTEVLPIGNYLTQDVRMGLWVLFGAVTAVLLIACSNFAGMQIARMLTREREFSVRSALGASRWTLMGQLVTENLVLFVVGGVLGLLLAAGLVPALVKIAPDALRQIKDVTVDWQVAAFTFGVCLFTGMLFGLLPAWRVTRHSVSDALKQRGGSEGGGQWLRRGLVTVQLALAVILLAGAGLLMRSFAGLQALDLGFRTEGVVTATVRLNRAKYASDGQIRDFFARTLEEIKADARVESVGMANTLLIGTLPDAAGSFSIEGRPAESANVRQPVTMNSVSEDYFTTIGEPLLTGRFFNRGDSADAPRVVIINETFARRYWPGDEAVGKRFKPGSPSDRDPWWTIVGVVADTRRAGHAASQWLEAYLPHAQSTRRSMMLVARTRAEEAAMAQVFRAAVRKVDPQQPIAVITSADAMVAERLAPRKFNMLLLSLFAVIALILAAVGLYGVMSYLVASRTREIGVRVAVGAQPMDILSLVSRQAMVMASIGMVAGVTGAGIASGLLRSMLFGVNAMDPLSFYGAIFLLLIAVALATLIPAWRALRVEPTEALRID